MARGRKDDIWQVEQGEGDEEDVREPKTEPGAGRGGWGKAQGGTGPQGPHITNDRIILENRSKREPNRSHWDSNPESSDVLYVVVRCLKGWTDGSMSGALFGGRAGTARVPKSGLS